MRFLEFYRDEFGFKVQFDWNNKSYNITHRTDKISFSEALKQETEILCDSIDELLNIVLSGERLERIITQARVFERTI